MLILFHKEACPYCQKVRGYMSEKGISYTSVVSETGSPSRKILDKLGGQAQVPFIVDTDNGEMMYESEKIVEYLENKYNGGF